MTEDPHEGQEPRSPEELLIPLSITTLTSEQKVTLARQRTQDGSYLDPMVLDIALDEMIEATLKEAS